MTTTGKLRTIRLEYDGLKGLEEGTALPLSAFATEELLRNAFEANVPIFVVDNDGQILWKLVFDSSNEKIVVKK